jgi:hypothetical protein
MFTSLPSYLKNNWIAVAALVVSGTSLTVSALGYFRDRPKLRIKAQRYRSDQDLG